MIDGAQDGLPRDAVVLNGELRRPDRTDGSLLDWLRDDVGLRGVKDGCSPQGQCGCCTVLVDAKPRVACVTPLRRVLGREITTIEGLERADVWAEALWETGGSQCGFCTPGIICRLDPLVDELAPDGEDATAAAVDAVTDAVEQGLLAHLCRCTGWQTITEAARVVVAGGVTGSGRDRDTVAATRRAELEGRATQEVGPQVALGAASFAADTAPEGVAWALSDGAGRWAVADSLAAARAAAGRTQGRRTTAPVSWPLAVPAGDWVATLQTTWVEPAYLETDASWCVPGGEPASPSANGGAFGAKGGPEPSSPIQEVARRLADQLERPVLALASREDTVRWGPKRPPVAAGIGRDGLGTLRVVATPGADRLLAELVPGWDVELVEVPGPSTSVDLRAALWAEIHLLRSAWVRRTGGPPSTAPAEAWVTGPSGGSARAVLTGQGPGAGIRVQVRAGEVLDETVLRSYCIGAAHMAYSWVVSESLATDDSGAPIDLTIRSFGVVRAIDMPHVEVVVEDADGPPVNGSDAVFAAVAAAVWTAQDCPTRLPTGMMLR